MPPVIHRLKNVLQAKLMLTSLMVLNILLDIEVFKLLLAFDESCQEFQRLVTEHISSHIKVCELKLWVLF